MTPEDPIARDIASTMGNLITGAAMEMMQGASAAFEQKHPTIDRHEMRSLTVGVFRAIADGLSKRMLQNPGTTDAGRALNQFGYDVVTAIFETVPPPTLMPIVPVADA